MQTYTYDSLNHLQSAAETIGGGQIWRQAFQYDRFGNRQFDLLQTTKPSTAVDGLPKVINPEIDASNNRLYRSARKQVFVMYDAAGSMIRSATGKHYDSENKQREVKDAGNISLGRHVYDGSGKRVKKIINAETTIFICGTFGKLAE